ncbi:MAG: hypothetical protein Q9Q40_09915, partial [Acidobacteriota bacterium]|nr:hypothetical protein [Acidobacteriota bacterium]
MDSFDCDPVPDPYPCAEPGAPVVTDWVPSEPLIQELKLEADPIENMAAYRSVSVLAEWYDDAAGQWKELWTHESYDAVERATAAGDEVATFGATGLIPGKQHRFRVAWCKENTTDRGCNCFAENLFGFLDVDPADGVPDRQPSTSAEFPSTPVTQPIDRQIEDRFHRPPSDPKRDRNSDALLGGDGLGPNGLWRDDLGTAGQNGAHIVDLGGGQWVAEIPANSELVYEPTLPDSHSYVELEFQPHCTTDQPNPPSNSSCSSTPINDRVDVRTRTLVAAGTVYTYFAQVLYEPDWTGTGGAVADPTIRLFRGSGPIGGTISGSPLIANARVEDAPAFSGATGEGCVINGQNKSPDPAANDLDGLEDGSPILFRIEVE